jgi:hypothetical protein
MTSVSNVENSAYEASLAAAKINMYKTIRDAYPYWQIMNAINAEEAM